MSLTWGTRANDQGISFRFEWDWRFGIGDERGKDKVMSFFVDTLVFNH